MADPITRDGEISSAESRKIERIAEALRPRNEGIRSHGGIGNLVAIVSLCINIGTGIYFSGKLVTRIEVLEKNQIDATQKQQASDAISVQHTVQIEVTKSKLSDIQAGIDRIEKTIVKR